MTEAIPKLRERIKDASMSDLKDFLENIRKHSSKIGEVAMKHVSFIKLNCICDHEQMLLAYRQNSISLIDNNKVKFVYIFVVA